ncbi:MAG: HD-GYP domain-containing protein [Treponema sp.]
MIQDIDVENALAIINNSPDIFSKTPLGYIPSCVLSGGQILCIIMRTLRKINSSFGDLSCRSAFIASSIAKRGIDDERLSLKNIMMLSLFHQVGNYHFFGENKIDYEQLTAKEITRGYLYAYHYLRVMTPVGEDAKFALFYDVPYDSQIASKSHQMEYASIVFTAQKIAELIRLHGSEYESKDFKQLELEKYNLKYSKTFKKIDAKRRISSQIADGSYQKTLEKRCLSLKFTAEETLFLLKLMLYLMDFKSTYTVTHTIHMSYYAVILGELAGCSENELNELFTAGLLHDIGKMAIPNSILESAGKLAPWEYTLMKKHVTETENIIRGIVPEAILNIAARHHEKLDGSGYPYGLTAKELSLSDKILACVDIFSALIDERSYKNRLPKSLILSIFKGMVEKKQLDEQICSYLFDYYEEIWYRCSLYSAHLGAPLGTVEISFYEDYANELANNVSELEDVG